VDRNLNQLSRCNSSFFGNLDSSQHCSLHLAFRSLLTDRTNVRTNSDEMLKNDTLMFSIYKVTLTC